MRRSDFLLDDDNNFSTADGDFVTGNSEDQDVEMLLQIQKGELKESPTIGVGLSRFLKKQNTSLAQIKREIKVGLMADNYKVTDLSVDAKGGFNVDYELDE